MNRTIERATVGREPSDGRDQLRTHLADLLDAGSFARRLKPLTSPTPREFACTVRATEPDRFIVNTSHRMPGPSP